MPPNKPFGNPYIWVTFSPSNFIYNYKRESYQVLDIIGDLGGVMDILLYIVSFFIAPFVEMDQLFEILKQLYVTKSNP